MEALHTQLHTIHFLNPVLPARTHACMQVGLYEVSSAVYELYAELHGYGYVRAVVPHTPAEGFFMTYWKAQVRLWVEG